MTTSRLATVMLLASALLAAGASGPAAPCSPALLAALRASVPIDAPALDEDPYREWGERAPPSPAPGTVCGIRFEPDRLHYRLATFGGAAAARAEGFAVTHLGSCGACSTLQDLAVYLERPDLTAPVRRCGVRLTASATLTCLEALGFSKACALIWSYNIASTRRSCLGVCLRSWIQGEPSAGPDGRLNGCLQCDEDRSGPVFKAYAGRTRRNSGIRSSIPRPDEEVAEVVHDYVPEREPSPPGATSPAR